ncbi:MAG: hypothetical protein WC212_01185 [Candidatus Delongbacteria bacterium]|jgi:hypothetical protein
MAYLKSDIERIIKECYWDYNVTAAEILNLSKNGTLRDKKKILEKIIYNSSSKMHDLMLLFDKDELLKMFNEFKPGDFCSSRSENLIPVLRNLIFGEKNIIKALEWKKR